MTFPRVLISPCSLDMCREIEMVLTGFQKIYFGMARLGPSMMLDMLDLSTALFYFSIQELPGIFTGVSIAISYLVIAASQFSFGYLSDRLKSGKWGRRKPFVMIGAPLMALSFMFIWIPHLFIGASDTIGLFIYAATTLSIFKLFYGLVTTPFQSWMPELTEPEERPSVSSWQNVANFLAFVLGTVGATLLAEFAISWGLPLVLVIFILAIMYIEIIGFIPSMVGLHKEGKFIPQPDIKKDLGYALKNRNFLGWLGARGLLSVGIAMVTATAFPFVNDYLQFGLIDLLMFGLELLGVVFGFFLVWRWMITNVGKRKTLQVSILVGVLALPLTLFVADKIVAYFLIALIAASVSGYYLFPYIIEADFAHVDEVKTGEGRAGIYTGFPSIPLNIFQAFSAILWGIIFSLPSLALVPGTTDTYLSLGYVYWGPVAAFFMFLSIIVLFKVDLDPDFQSLKQEYSAVESESISHDELPS